MPASIIRFFVLGLLLSALGSAAQFSLRLNEGDLTVSVKKQAIVKWTDHYLYEIVGDYIALLDTNSIFSVYRANGSTVVDQAKNIFQYVLRETYVVTLDNTKVLRIVRTTGESVFREVGVEEISADDTVLNYRVGTEWRVFQF